MASESPKIPESRIVYFWKPIEGEEGPEGKLLPRSIVYKDWKSVPASEKVEAVKVVVFGAMHSVYFVNEPHRAHIESANIPPRDAPLPPPAEKGKKVALEVLLPSSAKPAEAEEGERVDKKSRFAASKDTGNILSRIRILEDRGESVETQLEVAKVVDGVAYQIKRRTEGEADVGAAAKPAEKRKKERVRFADVHEVRKFGDEGIGGTVRMAAK